MMTTRFESALANTLVPALRGRVLRELFAERADVLLAEVYLGRGLTWANRGVSEFLGASVEALAGRGSSTFLHPEDFTRLHGKAQAAVSIGTIILGQREQIRRPGDSSAHRFMTDFLAFHATEQGEDGLLILAIPESRVPAVVVPKTACEFCRRALAPRRWWQRFCDARCRQAAFWYGRVFDAAGGIGSAPRIDDASGNDR